VSSETYRIYVCDRHFESRTEECLYCTIERLRAELAEAQKAARIAAQDAYGEPPDEPPYSSTDSVDSDFPGRP
jgi:hypothetical protein